MRDESLTPYTGGCAFFLQVKFATSLLALLAGDKITKFQKYLKSGQFRNSIEAYQPNVGGFINSYCWTLFVIFVRPIEIIL